MGDQATGSKIGEKLGPCSIELPGRREPLRFWCDAPKKFKRPIRGCGRDKRWGEVAEKGKKEA